MGRVKEGFEKKSPVRPKISATETELKQWEKDFAEIGQDQDFTAFLVRMIKKGIRLQKLEDANLEKYITRGGGGDNKTEPMEPPRHVAGNGK